MTKIILVKTKTVWNVGKLSEDQYLHKNKYLTPGPILTAKVTKIEYSIKQIHECIKIGL